MARVFKRQDSWWIDYYYQGTRHRQKIGAKRKAEEALAQIRVKIAMGEFTAPQSRQAPKPILTFEGFARKEFVPWPEGEHAASHHVRLRTILNVHLIPWFGKASLTEITTKQIADYKTSRRRDRCGVGKRRRAVNVATINRELCCLKALLKRAVEWGYIDLNPTDTVKISKETPRKTRLLEKEEVADLFEEMPAHLRAMIACAVYAGLRRSELFHLRWADVDLRVGELRVVSSMDHPTKSHETRQIPINGELREALQEHPHLGSPYVFANQEGRPYDNIRKSLLGAAERAGIVDGVGLHQLRHAFCSHSLMAGVDPRTTTLRYAHVSPAHEKEAIQRLSYGTRHQVGTEVG